MWAINMLDSINKELKKREMDKEQKNNSSLHSKTAISYNDKNLEELEIWTQTKEEQGLRKAFAIEMKGFIPFSKPQKIIIDFIKNYYKTYKDISDLRVNGLGVYIYKSKYWTKRTKTITTYNKKNIEITYACNEDVKMVIFNYNGKTIITTKSSFNRFLKYIENE